MKKILSSFMFLGLFFLVSDNVMAQDCRPNANQVSVFEHSGYRGKCSTRNVGNYPSAGAMGLRNDSMSSIIIGRNVIAVLCEHSSYRGKCQTFRTTDASLTNNSVGNDSVSSFRVILKRKAAQPAGGNCRPNANQISLFYDANYKGRCVTKNVGNYSSAGRIGLPNDSLSSIIVGRNVGALLCRDNNYRGTCETYRQNDSFLGNNSIGNDQVSSIKVFRKVSTPPTTARVNGRNVRVVYYNGGYFRQSGRGWVEYKANKRAVHARFTQTNRDEWSVYLRKSDGSKVQLDLYTKQIKLNGRRIYNITRVSK